MTATDNTATTRGQMLETAWSRFYELNLEVVFKRGGEGKKPYLAKTGVVVPADMHLRERLKQCCAKHNFEFRALDCQQVSSRQSVMRFYEEDLLGHADCLVLMDHISSLNHYHDRVMLSNLLVHAWKNLNIDLDNGTQLDPANYLVLFAFDAEADSATFDDIWYAGDGFGWYGDMLKL